MSDIKAILDELASYPSRLSKESILKREVNNEVLKQVFYLAYNSHIQFYIRQIPQFENNGRNESLTQAMNRLGLLSSRTLTGGAGIKHLSIVLSSVTASDAEVVKGIIAKDLRCGVNESTINKIWPGLVPEYPVMLASAYDEKLVEQVKYPAMVQLKMDGMRFNAIVRGNKCEFRTRNGRVIDLLGEMEAEFVAIAAGHDLVFDGELTVEDASGMLDRKTGNGILNKSLKGTISKDEAKLVVATIWDEIEMECFENAKPDDHPYSFRFNCLVDRVKNEAINTKIRIVPYHTVNSLDEARELFTEYHSAGQEGIILKTLDGIWENKRSKGLIKFKGELECDLVIVGVEPGTGKNLGKVGAFSCETADGVVKVSVGSGLSDEQRSRYITEDVIGRIIAVKYNARITNKQGQDSLFLPIFVEMREDKTVADSSKDVK